MWDTVAKPSIKENSIELGRYIELGLLSYIFVFVSAAAVVVFGLRARYQRKEFSLH